MVYCFVFFLAFLIKFFSDISIIFWNYLIWKPQHFIFNFVIRDRPLNLQGGGLWFFASLKKCSDDTRVRIFIFFVALSAKFFLQNLTLGYMTRTLNQIFFFLHQNQNIFFSNIGNQNIFLEKKHKPPLEVKWSTIP